jgi:hypothetical protein
MLFFISKEQSTIGVESFEDASAATGTEKVGLANWESARPTWALAGTTAAGAVGLADSGQAAEAVSLAGWEISLADSEHATIGSVDFELEGYPPLLLIGA